MKTLLSTTALVVALGLPAVALAQSTTGTSGTQQQSSQGSGFLSERGQSDLYASDLMGQDVYARNTQSGTNTGGQASGDRANMNADGSHGMAMMNRGDMDNMENIGQITEIVLSSDGQVRALVIGVGGFLGMGEQDVAVAMDQVTFANDADDQSHTYIIVDLGADRFMDAPAYDRTAMRDGMQGDRTQGDRMQDDRAQGDRTQGSDARSDRTAFTAPDMQRDGYDRVDVREVSTEMLMGKSVYDPSDNDVGTVSDMLISDDGKINNVIIDFGGFLGIGTSQAVIGFDELTILTNEGYADVRIYVDATKEQIQELPRYLAGR